MGVVGSLFGFKSGTLSKIVFCEMDSEKMTASMSLVSVTPVRWRYSQRILIAKMQKHFKFRPFFGPIQALFLGPVFPLWAALFSLCPFVGCLFSPCGLLCQSVASLSLRCFVSPKKSAITPCTSAALSVKPVLCQAVASPRTLGALEGSPQRENRAAHKREHRAAHKGQ